MLDLEKLANKTRFAWLTVEETQYLEQNFPWAKSNREAVWCLKHKVTNQPKCQYQGCDNYDTFRPRKGYEGCSKSHKTKLTNLEKFGVENVKQNKTIIEKARMTYHSRSEEEKKEMRNRKDQTMMVKYGVIDPNQLSEIKEKISKKNIANAATRMIQLKKNNQEKYGVDNVFQLETVKEKSRLIFQEKYNVDNPSQSSKIKLKKEETCFKNHGVRFPAHDIIIFEKQQKYRWKNYTMPSGKVISIQGYEGMALDILLKTYDESELVVDRKSIPKIIYGENLDHQYITDIFIPKENRFIEVKSTYTFIKYLKINLLKEQASIAAGYVFDFMILDGKGNVLDTNKIITQVLPHQL